MSINKKLTIIGIIILLCIVAIPTIYKVVNDHYDNMYKVVENKIIEAAKKCYYEEKCTSEVSLETLYSLDYLDKVSNPKTKEYFNEKSYIIINGDNYKFIEVE